MVGVGCAKHCKFKTVVVVIFASSLESKEPKVEARQQKKLPSVVNEKDTDEEIDEDW